MPASRLGAQDLQYGLNQVTPRFGLHQRGALLELLSNQADTKPVHWDLVVIGGGITGAGVLREAARLGLRVLLVEQQDFAWGTSSRSSKMVHGGLRYLAQGDFGLTRHSLLERERLLQEAPGLVERMGYYFTLGRHKSPPAWGVRALLWLYDRIAGIRDHYKVSLDKLAAHFPGLACEGLNGAYYYTDAVTDDSRLVQRVLHESIAAGGAALNYVQVKELSIDDAGEVCGVVLQDQCEPDTVNDQGLRKTFLVKAKVVVNATGAWADRLRNQVNPEKRVRPLRGSHVVLSAGRLTLSAALTLQHPDDHRSMFIYPWENRTIIGTTDLDHTGDLDVEARISQQEVDYLLRAANQLFPQANLQEADIVSSWAGVRPVIGSENNKDPSKERRDHAVWKDGRLISVSGGKLTTFRLIALDVLAVVAAELDIRQPAHDETIFAPCQYSVKDLGPCDEYLAATLLGRYGDRAHEIVSGAAIGELEPIGETRFCLAECRWVLKHDAVVHLDDLMLRRTRLGLLLRDGGSDIMEDIKRLCCVELGWDQAHWLDELTRYELIWQHYYSLPCTEPLPERVED